MIPRHLEIFPWYAPHQAHCLAVYGWARHSPPEGTVAARANLRDANLTDANLTDADLTGANLTYANLTGANLTYADLTYANLTGANLTYANLTDADLTDAIGLVAQEEEAATLAACVEAIAAAPADLWNQAIWHHEAYRPEAATEVGACGTAHCLAGWAQALLPVGDERRRLHPQTCGSLLLPRAASQGWFGSDVHPDLAAAVAAARARLAVPR
jgi:hypothetical protein